MDQPWRNALADYIQEQAKPVEKFGHQPRLYTLARQVAEGLEYDDDVVYAAAWLHDLGVFIGHRPEDPAALAAWNHVTYTVERVPGILISLGFPGDKLQGVLEVIRTHQPSNNPLSIEGVIVRDADILEQLGAIGVLRTVCKVGRDTRFNTFSDAVAALHRASCNLPGQLRLETSRRLAEPKVQALQSFLAAVQAESRGALY